MIETYVVQNSPLKGLQALVAFAFVVESSFVYISAKKHEILPK